MFGLPAFNKQLPLNRTQDVYGLDTENPDYVSSPPIRLEPLLQPLPSLTPFACSLPILRRPRFSPEHLLRDSPMTAPILSARRLGDIGARCRGRILVALFWGSRMCKLS